MLTAIERENILHEITVIQNAIPVIRKKCKLSDLDSETVAILLQTVEELKVQKRKLQKQIYWHDFYDKNKEKLTKGRADTLVFREFGKGVKDLTAEERKRYNAIRSAKHRNSKKAGCKNADLL